MNQKPDPNNDKAKAARFDALRRATAINAAHNNLTEEEAIALVDSIRQEIFEEQKESKKKPQVPPG